MKKFYKIEWPHGHGGQPGKPPAQVLEHGVQVGDVLLTMYREKGAAVTECNEDGSPLQASDPKGNNPPSGGSANQNSATLRDARAAELAAMKYDALCELAKGYGIAGPGRKRAAIEADILAAEFPKTEDGAE